MSLPFQFIANKTQSHNNDSLWLKELVLPNQVILLLASCSPAELASSSDYIANKQNYFEMWLFCKMMLTAEGVHYPRPRLDLLSDSIPLQFF
jgi:hypothetical protein